MLARLKSIARNVIGASAVALAATSLIGCGDDEYQTAAKPLRPPATSPVVRLDPGPTIPQVEVPAIPANDLQTDLGISTERYTEFSNRDLVEKADIYWKFFWMNKALETGNIPHDVPGELDKISARVAKLHPDKNVSAIAEVLKELRKGVDASRLAARLTAGGLRVETLGWSGGAFDVSVQIKAAVAPSKADRSRHIVIPADLDRDATQWAGRYHESPTESRRQAFEMANQKTLALGDSLDDERKQVGEHLIGRDQVVSGALPSKQFESSLPAPAIR